MLHKVRELITRPTQHADVRCTIHYNGLRFCVETRKRGGQAGTSIEHVNWSELEDSQQAAEERLEAAYTRCLDRADRWVREASGNA